MTTWLDSHALELWLTWYVFSAVVSGMPAPETNAGLWYRWAFHSLHILAGDLSHYLTGH
ncbi:MAG TPA: hypothetical protein VN515_02960 [Terriglobales bacterium]|nr:hypothetical protein [Terriglobales bacterium]